MCHIGLDHFAKPDDSLAIASGDKTLHRNFQGYTTRADCDLIGLGLSSIGKVGYSYVQSLRTLDEYYACLDEGKLPVEKGFDLSNDDALRREIIMNLMCSNSVIFSDLRKLWYRFLNYFASELNQISLFSDEGLIAISPNSIEIRPKGRLFVRAVAMVFDRFLGTETTAKYSRLI